MASWLKMVGTVGDMLSGGRKSATRRVLAWTGLRAADRDDARRPLGPVRWRRDVSPRWLPPAMAAAAVVVGVLAAVVERGGLDGTDDPDHVSPVSIALIVLVTGACLVETWGVPWPRLAYVVAVVLPAVWFTYTGRNTAAPVFLSLLVAWAAYTWPRREAVIALVASLLAVLLPLPWGADPFSDWLPWLIGITLSWLSMLAVASQQRLLAELHAAQADLARRSAAQERQRIAREVHDVIAHTLAVTMLHLTGARHILTRDPERAAEALAEAERLGRQSLADIRRTVGLLGEGTDGAAVGTAPLPGAADLPALVTGYVRAGMQARLRMDGDPRRLPAAAGLDLYRIAQEALTNAVKHAPGAAVAVSLTIAENEARLRIVDDGPRDGAPEVPTMRGLSLGLAGMRERAALLGGSLTVGREGAGWLVECVVPLHSTAPQSGPAGRDPREDGP